MCGRVIGEQHFAAPERRAQLAQASAAGEIAEGGKRRAERGFEGWTGGARLSGRTFDIETAGALRQVLHSRRSLRIPDTYAFAGWDRPPGTEYIRSWMGVPLIRSEPTSRSRTLSPFTTASVFPSGLNVTELITALCPIRTAISFCSATSHKQILLI